MNPDELEIRLIEWTDSASYHGWQSVDHVELLKPDLCYSVGFVFREDDDCVVLILGTTNRNLKDSENQIDGSIAIPKVAIVKMQTLRKGTSYVSEVVA